LIKVTRSQDLDREEENGRLHPSLGIAQFIFYQYIVERINIVDLSKFQQFIPYLIPVLIIQLVLMITALVDLIRREHTLGPKWIWVLVILLVNYIGPIIYFVAGRKDE
jgi:hypothetical protein